MTKLMIGLLQSSDLLSISAILQLQVLYALIVDLLAQFTFLLPYAYHIFLILPHLLFDVQFLLLQLSFALCALFGDPLVLHLELVVFKYLFSYLRVVLNCCPMDLVFILHFQL